MVVVVGLFWPLIQAFQPLLSWLPTSFLPFLPYPISCQGFTTLSQPPKQQSKQKLNQFSKTTVCGLHIIFEVIASSVKGCLNTLRLFSLGGELTLIFFLFLVEEITTKMNRIFVVLRRIKVFTPI